MPAYKKPALRRTLKMSDWFDPANVALLLNLDTSRYTQTKDEDEHID